jgi:hypothetical protein
MWEGTTTQIDGFAKLIGPAGDHEPPAGRFSGQPLERFTAQRVGHLIKAIQEKCDAASIEKLTDRIWPEICGPQIGVVLANRCSHPIPKTRRARIPGSQREPYRHRYMSPGRLGQALTVAKSLQQQQDHRPGLTSARATKQHEPSLMQPGVHLVMQSSHQARVEHLSRSWRITIARRQLAWISGQRWSGRQFLT